MTARPDPSLLRRRRAIEGITFISRGSGLLAAALFLARWFGMPAPAAEDRRLIVVCLAGIAVMAVLNVFALINFRHLDGPRYAVLSACQVAGDILLMSGIVLWVQVDGQITIWPGLIVPIVAGALRHRLRGALIAWAATSAAFAGTVITLGDDAVRAGDLLFAIAIPLFVAVLSGTLSSALARQAGELHALRTALRHQAARDGLTGLPNRAQLAEYADGQAGREIAVLLIELNGFKQVNDTLGHAAGDSLLREAGHRLSTNLRVSDMVGRMSGAEFVVLLPDTDPTAAAEVSARLYAEIGRPMYLDGQVVSVGVTIGAAHRPGGDAAGLTALTAAANAAMPRERISGASASEARRVPSLSTT
ncbi:GGDEF domain-containing protein [Actinoplanes sp. NPDC049118]|uniref:GGDEF domain-containing protein n=1 Tax=Actinoplanes sp. NPDC049118 TaxID=3155769 RepID=UPI003402B738